MEPSFRTLVVGEKPQSPVVPTGPTWGRLFGQHHGSYDAALWLRLDLLHKGGFAIQRQADLFITRAPQEPEVYYKWRLGTTAYMNYMARVVGFLVGGLFGVPLKVSPEEKAGAGGGSAASAPDEAFYDAFALNCDLRGTDFSQFMRARLVDALVQRRSLIGVDMPVGGGEAANRAQEEELGIGAAWLYEIPLESMLDWETDDKNRFKWCKLVKKVYDRSDPLGNHSTYTYEFKIWTLVGEGAGQKAAYEIYRTKPVTQDEELKPEDEVPLVQELTVTSFSRIPIVEMALPHAVWAGNQIGPLCVEHYNGRSDLRGSMCRSLVEIPYVKRGPELPAVHGEIMSVTQQDPNRGSDPVGRAKRDGWVGLGSDDEIGFAGPSGKAFEMTAAELSRTRDEIFGALNTMALALDNTASTVKRSGESKAEDRSATSVILDYLGDELRETGEMVYDTVSSGRGEKAAWRSSGVDSYDDDDRGELIEEATEVGMLTIPSKTFKRLYAVKVAHACLPKASQTDKDTITKEIEEGMTDDMVLPAKPVIAAPPGKGGASGALPAKGAPPVAKSKPAPVAAKGA